MTSTLRSVSEAVGTEKFSVLAAAVDRVIDDQGALREGLRVDDEIETLDMATLALEFGVTLPTLRKQIQCELGMTAAFKLGKKWVIRKRTFLEYLRRKESAPPQDSR